MEISPPDQAAFQNETYAIPTIDEKLETCFKILTKIPLVKSAKTRPYSALQKLISESQTEVSRVGLDFQNAENHEQKTNFEAASNFQQIEAPKKIQIAFTQSQFDEDLYQPTNTSILPHVTNLMRKSADKSHTTEISLKIDKLIGLTENAGRCFSSKRNTERLPAKFVYVKIQNLESGEKLVGTVMRAKAIGSIDPLDLPIDNQENVSTFRVDLNSKIRLDQDIVKRITNAPKNNKEKKNQREMITFEQQTLSNTSDNSNKTIQNLFILGSSRPATARIRQVSQSEDLKEVDVKHSVKTKRQAISWRIHSKKRKTKKKKRNINNQARFETSKKNIMFSSSWPNVSHVRGVELNRTKWASDPCIHNDGFEILNFYNSNKNPKDILLQEDNKDIEDISGNE
ncbi:hypothetical protein HK096_010247, partial [Nowakowskiella sp. JEL0078]